MNAEAMSAAVSQVVDRRTIRRERYYRYWRGSTLYVDMIVFGSGEFFDIIGDCYWLVVNDDRCW